MKKTHIIWTIAIIVIVVIIAVVSSKNSTTGSYTHSSGAFSFKYPKALVAFEQDKIVYLAQATSSTTPILALGVKTLPNLLPMTNASTSGVATSSLSIPGYEVLKLTSLQAPDLGFHYLVPLDEGDNPSTFFIIIKFGTDESGITEVETEAILRSLKMNKTKTAELLVEMERIVEQLNNPTPPVTATSTPTTSTSSATSTTR